MDVQYWHWLVFGLILIIAEVFIPSFTIIWFGLGALAVGGILWISPMELTAQLLLWAFFSALLTAFWFVVMKPRMLDKTLVQTSLRSIIGEMDLDDALSSRDRIKARLKETISDDISDWGITLKTVEIQDINPSDTMQHAMEEQAAAERARRATVTRAEGDKTAAILQADGRLEASRRDAEAKVVLAEADQAAINKVSEASKSGELPLVFLLGQRYVDAMRSMAEANNAKIVVLPADLPAAVRGIMGTLGK